MGKIWWSEMELFQRLLALRQQSEAAIRAERRGWAAERAELHARLAALERENESLRSRACVMDWAGDTTPRERRPELSAFTGADYSGVA